MPSHQYRHYNRSKYEYGKMDRKARQSHPTHAFHNDPRGPCLPMYELFQFQGDCGPPLVESNPTVAAASIIEPTSVQFNHSNEQTQGVQQILPTLSQDSSGAYAQIAKHLQGRLPLSQSTSRGTSYASSKSCTRVSQPVADVRKSRKRIKES